MKGGEEMENLRALRKSKHLTMKELGDMVGVSESMIGMIETGSRKPGYELLLKLGEALDCSVDNLINGKTNPSTEADGDDMHIQLREDLRNSYAFRVLYDTAEGATDADLLEAAALLARRKEERTER